MNTRAKGKRPHEDEEDAQDANSTTHNGSKGRKRRQIEVASPEELPSTSRAATRRSRQLTQPTAASRLDEDVGASDPEVASPNKTRLQTKYNTRTRSQKEHTGDHDKDDSRTSDEVSPPKAKRKISRAQRAKEANQSTASDLNISDESRKQKRPRRDENHNTEFAEELPSTSKSVATRSSTQKTGETECSDTEDSSSDSEEEKQLPPESEQESDEDDDEDTASTQDESLRAGKIKRLHLVNIMCHSNITVDLNEHCSFIVGANGSGKSAILTALLLALGGRARDSGRSSNFKDLIKRGATHARIEVTVVNEGWESYNPKKYGKTITVVRNITPTSSTYCLKDENGHVISRRADDLQRMLMLMNIQVTNPIFVMNQDNGRDFLKHMTPKKNYDIFLKASQIEYMMDSIHFSEKMFLKHRARNEANEVKLADTTKEWNDLKGILERIKSVRTIRTQMEKMELEMEWLNVEKHEQALEAHNLKYPELLARRSELERNTRSRTAMHKEFEARISAAKELLKSLQREMQQCNEEFNTHQRDVLTMESARDDSVEQLNSYTRKQKGLLSEIEEIKKSIAETENNAADVASLRAENQLKIEEYHKEQTANTEAIAAMQNEVKAINDRRFELIDQHKEVQGKLEAVHKEKTNLKGILATKSKNTKDRLAIFPPAVIQLVAEIKKAHSQGKFSEMPRGPLGQYIQVPDARYVNAVEQQLMGVLNYFVVNSVADRKVIDQIVRQKNADYTPSIITTRFSKQVYDVSGGRVRAPQGTALLMDVIQCSDPVVMNCLIDRLHIETILLTTSKPVAEQFTRDIENVPRHLSKMVVLLPTNMCLEYHPEPRYRMYSRRMTPARILQVDVQQQIKHLTENYKQCEEKANSLMTSVEQLKDEMRTIKEQLGSKHGALEALKDKQRELRDKIEELENYEYPFLDNMIRQDLEVREKRLASIEKLLLDAKKEYDDKNEELQGLMEGLKQRKAAVVAVQRKIDEQMKQIEDEQMQKRKLDQRFQQMREDLQAVSEELKSLDVVKAELEAKVVSSTQQASAKGERITSEHTIDQLAELILGHKKMIELNQDTAAQNDPEEVRREIKHLRKTIKKKKQNHKKHTHFINVFYETLKIRHQFLRKYRTHVALQVEFYFHRLLETKGFCGKMEFDYQAETLDMEVSKTQGDDVAGTKSLSGGERSYTTLAFLLSLWSVVDHPFFVLDEYDVFTDDVNRALMNNLLLTEMRKRPNRQFCFLTPLPMAVEAADDVTILKMQHSKDL